MKLTNTTTNVVVNVGDELAEYLLDSGRYRAYRDEDSHKRLDDVVEERDAETTSPSPPPAEQTTQKRAAAKHEAKAKTAADAPAPAPAPADTAAANGAQDDEHADPERSQQPSDTKQGAPSPRETGGRAPQPKPTRGG